MKLAAIHPLQRDYPLPVDDECVGVNPPCLLWPVTEGEGVRYAIRLSTQPSLSDADLVTDDLEWAIYCPHHVLAQGDWYWQYAVLDSGERTWSEVLRFRVPWSARVSDTPTAAELLAMVPRSHPRLMATHEELLALRERLAAQGLTRRFREACDRYYMGQELPPDEPPAEWAGLGEPQAEKNKYRGWAAKGLANSMKEGLDWLVPAYLASGDERYGREAVRWALHVARWNPDGTTAWFVNDFAFAALMHAMAIAYDSCHALLTEDERALMREAISHRARHVYHTLANQLEARAFSAHVWQIALREFAEAGFALLHESDEASKWAAYAYELWWARFPTLGGDDGGWANGNNYFAVNFETMVFFPALFRRFSGVDFYDLPWYRNVGRYLLYTWPPGSVPDGFGDGVEFKGKPEDRRLWFAEQIGREMNDPYALWYAAACAREKDREPDLSPSIAWQAAQIRDRSTVATTVPPSDLAQARVFRDIGVAVMHTHLEETEPNLMVSLRSSPHGGHNHMHSCQNSFNVAYGGRRLFNNTGYYCAYGDDHFLQDYQHTRGHNTVLIDGKGQGPDGPRQDEAKAAAYGWIARFLHGQRISYCLGDASNAYPGTGLRAFRRHLLFLRPSTIIVFDELEADHAANWTWLLHSSKEMAAAGQRILVPGTDLADLVPFQEGELQATGRQAPDATRWGRFQRTTTLLQPSTAQAAVNLYGTTGLDVVVDVEFRVTPKNWRFKSVNYMTPDVFPNQWHARVSPSTACQAMRYLAVIQVNAGKDATALAACEQTGGGWLSVGDWRVRAELDPARKPSLLAEHREEPCRLAVDVANVALPDGSSLDATDRSALVEVTGGQRVLLVATDELPQAAKRLLGHPVD